MAYCGAILAQPPPFQNPVSAAAKDGESKLLITLARGVCVATPYLEILRWSLRRIPPPAEPAALWRGGEIKAASDPRLYGRGRYPGKRIGGDVAAGVVIHDIISGGADGIPVE